MKNNYVLISTKGEYQIVQIEKEQFLNKCYELINCEIIEIRVPNVFGNMDSQSSRNVVRFLNKLEKKYGKNFKNIFKSITVDNGSEFSDCKGMEKSIFNGQRTKVYYCHPYSSWERGSNERMNREIRRLIPKGTNIGKISTKEIAHVQNWVNSYPREIFGYATSEELFQYELQLVA